MIDFGKVRAHVQSVRDAVAPNAWKERFIAIPGTGQIGFDEITYPQPSPGAPPGWRFPDGTVLVKTFGMEMERGNPKSKKRLETRLLHFQQFPGTQEYGDQYWRGYTYVWNDEQTDATLSAAPSTRSCAHHMGTTETIGEAAVASDELPAIRCPTCFTPTHAEESDTRFEGRIPPVSGKHRA